MAYENLNFEEVGPRFVKANEHTKGDVLVTGEFSGTVPGYNGNEQAPSYLFTEPNGSVVTVYYFADLGKKMAGIKEGMICRLTHDGTYTIPVGKRNAGTVCQNVRVQCAGMAKEPQAPTAPAAPTLDEFASDDEEDL